MISRSRLLSSGFQYAFWLLLVAMVSCSSHSETDVPADTGVPSTPFALVPTARQVAAPIRLGPTIDLGAPSAFVAVNHGWTAVAGRLSAHVDAGRIALAVPTASPSAGEGASLSISTQRAGRDGVPTAPNAGASRLEGGDVVTVHDGSVERLSPRNDGLEQSWTFDELPQGTGDLRIDVSVAGMPWMATDADGVHFGNGPSSVGIRYSHATWVDARGQRTRIEAGFVDGAIEMVVPESLLRASAFPATLDPTVSPEFPLDTRAITEPSPYAAQRVAIASDGTDFLAVWSETRGIQRIFATRVRGSDGTILDPYAIAIQPSSTRNADSPDVAFDGTNYFVVWADSATGNFDVHGARVRPSDGRVLDATPLDVAPSHNTEYAPSVACDAANCVVAWGDGYFTGNAVVATRVRSSDGTVLDPSGVFVGSPTTRTSTQLEFDGTNYLAIWQRTVSFNDDVIATRIRAADMAVLDPVPIAVSAGPRNETSPAVAFDGTDYFATWIDDRSLNRDFYGARIRPSDGAVLDPTGISLESSALAQASPAMTATPGGVAMAWVAYNQTTLTAYDLQSALLRGSDGALIAAAAPLPPTPGNQTWPAVSYGSGNLLFAWLDANAPAGIRAERVRASDRTILDAPPLRLSMISNQETAPAVAFDGTYFFAAWVDDRTAPSGIYGVRIRPDGTVVDSPAIRIPGGTGSQLNPAVTAGGGNFYVVWEDKRGTTSDLYGSRIRSSDATILDPGGTNVSLGSGDETRPSAAFDGTNFYVVWEDSRGPAFGTRVSAADGTPSTPLGAILTSVNANRAVVACSATECAVACVSSSVGRVLAIRIRTSDGAVLDTTPIAVDGSTAYYPSIASDGTDFLIGWYAIGNVVARLLRSDGSLPYPTLVGTAIPLAVQSSVSFDGTYWVDAWSSNGVSVRRVVHAGDAFQDAAAIAVNTDNSFNPRIGVASTPTGRSLIAYERRDFTGDGGTRVRARFFDTLPPNGAPCTSASQCESNFCVDGVCCASACGGGVATDCLACSVAAGGRTDGTCATVAAGRTCRAAAGGCDVAETCDGSSSACPADRYAGPIVCRPAASPCDRAELCSGTSPVCPSDAFAPSGTLCRTAASVCDVAERCDGTSGVCPPDIAAPAGRLCRASTGVCDAAESCDGASPQCPADLAAPAGTLCRDVRGVCDVAETCDGTSTVCPPDSVVPAGSIECRPAVGPCDVADQCDGFAADCPDRFAPSTTVCRAPAGPCDVAESCNGLSANCPVDAFVPRDTLECRAAASVCDAPERCDGSQAACPVDLPAPLGVTCRPAVGPCDVADYCDGVSMSCSADRAAPDGTFCDDNLDCDGRETCHAGVCTSGPPRDCADNQACTLDTCDERRGCVHTPVTGCVDPDAGANDSGTVDAAVDVVDAAADVTNDTVPDAAVRDADGDAHDAAVDTSPDVSTAPVDVVGDSPADGGTGSSRGCGCRAAGQTSSRSSGVLFVTLAALVIMGRRRRVRVENRSRNHVRVESLHRGNRWAVATAAVALVLSGCGPSTEAMQDASSESGIHDGFDAAADIVTVDVVEIVDSVDIVDTSAPDTGADVPNNDAPMIAPHVFDACLADSNCAGVGFCDRTYPGGLCTHACSADADCGAEGRCVSTRCIPYCTPNDLKCDRWGAACGTLGPAARHGCLPSCFVDSPPRSAPLCNPGFVCDLATGRCGAVPTGAAGDGERCVTDADCMSGTCIPESSGTGFIDGMCAGYGRQPDYRGVTEFTNANCPSGTVAVPIQASNGQDDQAYCLLPCATDGDCRRGYACLHGTMTNGYCYPADCSSPGEACPTGYVCRAVVADAMNTHRCVACSPSCSGRACGDNGCGGSCGTCPNGQSCNASGQCSCARDCTGRACGSDGCGGTCGNCASGLSCNAFGQCACVPDCTGRTCGSDGCGGSCGSCTGSDVCAAGSCVACTPACSGRTCGPDGCGGVCGSCAAGQICNSAGVCACVPDCTGRTCGSDGCGGSCGACPTGQTCDGLGACVCVPDCSSAVCGNDGCGGSCGACPTGSLCTGGSCVACTRNCTGRTCGPDGCGGSCGTCSGSSVCNASGTCVAPPCNPVTQTGCPSGQRCTWNGTAPVCVSNGYTARGDECFGETCVAGSMCANDGYGGICRKFCSTDSDCGAGRCVYSLTGSSYRLCSYTCDPTASSTGCGSGAACHVSDVGTATEVRDCSYWGVNGVGGACSNVEDCGNRLTCTSSCQTLCRLGTSCSTGACRTVAGWTTFGVCP